MRSKTAYQIRQTLKQTLFKDKKHQFNCNDTIQINETPSITLYKNFNEVYCYKNKRLGEGAHGIVKLCYKKLECNTIQYAVKIFRTGDPEIISTIKKTFKINRQLNDLQCVIKAIDLFINVTKEEIHFVMELCPYPSLDKLIQQKITLSIKQQQLLIFELAKAIDKIHSKCVCHRDLKPDNILVQITDDDAKIKIIDFGVSKKFVTKTRNSTLNIEMWTRTGSLFYQAPEIFAGGGYNQKVDIWAIGVIVYQLFCYGLPFQQDQIIDTIEMICDPNYNVENTAKFESLDQLQQDLLKRLLRKEPEKRLTSKEFILHPWLYPYNQEHHQSKVQLYLNQEKDKNLSISEELLGLGQLDQNMVLTKEPYCASTIFLNVQEKQKEIDKLDEIGTHIYFYSSSKQLNRETERKDQDQQQTSVTQLDEIQDVCVQENHKTLEDDIELNNYKTVGSIILN
ncbi:unnamed protein product (macronuclear) [Paramecium tetraurelia]|uniref:Protein kinase domain-containing protein n=1 Tax=Paramecium tetraurelia TaxID=5888 RepID=A0DEU7_PARTE|nr:uncharacterized protein GSPATT00016390001 [Paramecium tetraurelia]CAK81564.1 unnamed protein product [Paramecium tetraurelia]|eukprot:XP_001448961.1 hypothetical protein (macronuclear) [Paramecium tetraurelia strain d4-2]